MLLDCNYMFETFYRNTKHNKLNDETCNCALLLMCDFYYQCLQICTITIEIHLNHCLNHIVRYQGFDLTNVHVEHNDDLANECIM